LATYNLETIRLDQIKFENEYLSPFATKSNKTLGRIKPEDSCPIRNEFQRDRDRILHSKAFRRLKHKTQVFFSPLGDHYRTRMTHTLEVSQISRTIARALRLHEDLTEAISLGHDLGHTPFGHTGEEVLDKLLKNGFKHNLQSVRVVSLIEDLNLTAETLDGIKNHTGPDSPFTLEGQIVKIADRIAYLNHDIDDAVRAGLIKFEDIPTDCREYFGNTNQSRITKMTVDIIQNSINKDKIYLSDECKHFMDKLRSWMFENVYIGSSAKKEETKAKKILEELYFEYIDRLKNSGKLINQNEESIEQTVADYIAGMTDRYAIKKYKEIFIPSPTQIHDDETFLNKLAKNNRIID
jgi:dGTPase